MMKLVVICVTVLLCALVREWGATARLALELEDRYQARLFSEYVRQHPIPTIEIVPEFNHVFPRPPKAPPQGQKEKL
jgi:hypothetical protein